MHREYRWRINCSQSNPATHDFPDFGSPPTRMLRPRMARSRGIPLLRVPRRTKRRPIRSGGIRGRERMSRMYGATALGPSRSEEHTSELQSPCNLVCRLLLEKKKIKQNPTFRPQNNRKNTDA